VETQESSSLAGRVNGAKEEETAEDDLHIRAGRCTFLIGFIGFQAKFYLNFKTNVSLYARDGTRCPSLPLPLLPPSLSLSLSLSLSRRHACEVLEERMSMSPPKGATSLLSHLPQRNCEIDTNRMFSPSPRCRANYLLRSKTLPANLSRRRGSEMYPECYKERRSSLTRTFFFLFF